MYFICMFVDLKQFCYTNCVDYRCTKWPVTSACVQSVCLRGVGVIARVDNSECICAERHWWKVWLRVDNVIFLSPISLLTVVKYYHHFTLSIHSYSPSALATKSAAIILVCTSALNHVNQLQFCNDNKVDSEVGSNLNNLLKCNIFHLVCKIQSGQLR